MRPYTRSLHPDDYEFLREYNTPLVGFQRHMAELGVPHREWHPHRFWEYSSILQQLDELNVPHDAKLIDIGSGACFFAPYLAKMYPNLEVTDSMKYGDVSPMLEEQRRAYGVTLKLHDSAIESMPMIASDTYDVTMCISTIEHVDQHDAGFLEIVRITKPGGLIFITSDYFRDWQQWEVSPSKHLQITPYMKDFVQALPVRFPVDFVGETDLDYAGDFIHGAYSFVNICLRKRAASTSASADDNGKAQNV